MLQEVQWDIDCIPVSIDAHKLVVMAKMKATENNIYFVWKWFTNCRGCAGCTNGYITGIAAMLFSWCSLTFLFLVGNPDFVSDISQFITRGLYLHDYDTSFYNA